MKVDEMRPQAAATPEIRAGAHSAKGLREENQDAMTRFQSRYGEVVLVADGMGGHQGGAVASDMVARRFRFHLDAAAETTMSVADALQQAATRVNDEIYERGHSGDPAVAGMGSTLVVAVLRPSPAGQEAIVANAGDSRAYLLRDGVLRQLTKDHTAAQRMVDAGVISAADARSHPQASVLSRALGQQIGTTVETYPPVTLLPGDGLLLCSDGLSGYALDPEIAQAIGSASDPNAVVRNLVELALNRGSDDNITVQFLRLGGGGAEAPPLAAKPVNPPKRFPLVPIVAVVAVLVAGSAGWMAWHYYQTHKPQHDRKKDTNKKTTAAQHGKKEGDVAPQHPAQGQNPPVVPQTQNPPIQNPPIQTPPIPPGQNPPVPLGHNPPIPEGQNPPAPPTHNPPVAQPQNPGAPRVEPGGEGPAPPPGPTDQQKAKKTSHLVLYVPDWRQEPKWIHELMQMAIVKPVAAETSGPFTPGEEIVAWFRKDAKAEFDRMAAKIPALRNARRRPSDEMPDRVDIIIVMPR